MALLEIALAWGLVITLSLEVAKHLWLGWRRTQYLHQIPCSHCRYLVDHPALKCTVHPQEALTPQAIGCRDYGPLQGR
ncbi:MAG: hypothetical protein IGQ88_02775 [Gloeomargaritaceae cyanobacterium C42_A2020_066]|nr:hypothetical protein [Gloeomargaritaceae cyanobacterium C42_A2020_066]